MLPPKFDPRLKNQIVWPRLILHQPHLGGKSAADCINLMLEFDVILTVHLR